MWATSRLRIEPLAEEHAVGLHAALDDPRVGEFIGGPDVTTVEALVDRIARLAAGPPSDAPDDEWINLVVRLADDGTVIGRLEATSYGEWAEVAYVLGPRWWGAGYATEALEWFLGHLDHAEVWAAVHPGNVRSAALLERTGFVRVDAPGRPIGSFDPGDLVFVWHREVLSDDGPSSGSASSSDRAG